MNCKKCTSPRTIILRQKDYYCDACFIQNTNHKFRACLGKNKVLSPNQNVLVCLSGGIGSTVLLDLIHHGLSLDNTKKLRIIPYFLHIIDTDSGDPAESIVAQCSKYNYNVYVLHISEYLNTNRQLIKANSIPELDQNFIDQFQNMLNNMTYTAANDFLIKIKRSLFITYSKLLQCDIIFTAETTSTLAINLLCNLALGRGLQVQNDVGFSDSRDDIIKILRPMKDISKEELDYYIVIKKLQPVYNSLSENKSSLQSVITSFVCDLQENYQSTISTVCKTADKIGDHSDGKTQEKCIICESDLNIKKFKISALEATNISRTISFRNCQIDHETELTSIFENDTHTAVFPLINKYLCYGCSRNHSEMHQPSLPQHMQNTLNS